MKLNQVTVPTKNVEVSKQFYQTLGFEMIVSSEHYARFYLADGGATFSIHLVDELPKGEGVYTYFECEKLDETVGKLKDKGIIFEHEAKDQSWLWREARLTDPDGNKLILYWAGENRVYPPWGLKSRK